MRSNIPTKMTAESLLKKMKQKLPSLEEMKKRLPTLSEMQLRNPALAQMQARNPTLSEMQSRNPTLPDMQARAVRNDVSLLNHAVDGDGLSETVEDAKGKAAAQRQLDVVDEAAGVIDANQRADGLQAQIDALLLRVTEAESVAASAQAEVGAIRGGEVKYSYDGPFAVERIDEGRKVKVGQGCVWAGITGFYNFPQTVGVEDTLDLSGLTAGWYVVSIDFSYNGLYTGNYAYKNDFFGTGPTAPFEEPYVAMRPLGDYNTSAGSNLFGPLQNCRILATFYYTGEEALHMQQRHYGDIYLYVHAIWAPEGAPEDYAEPADYPDTWWKFNLSQFFHRPNVYPTGAFALSPYVMVSDDGGSNNPDTLSRV